MPAVRRQVLAASGARRAEECAGGAQVVGVRLVSDDSGSRSARGLHRSVVPSIPLVLSAAENSIGRKTRGEQTDRAAPTPMATCEMEVLVLAPAEHPSLEALPQTLPGVRVTVVSTDEQLAAVAAPSTRWALVWVAPAPASLLSNALQRTAASSSPCCWLHSFSAGASVPPPRPLCYLYCECAPLCQ